MKASQLVGKVVSLSKDIDVFEKSWNKPYAVLPSGVFFPSKVIRATTNSNGNFVQFKDSKTGNTAVIRFAASDLKEVKEPTGDSFMDFIKSKFGKLLFINLL